MSLYKPSIWIDRDLPCLSTTTDQCSYAEKMFKTSVLENFVCSCFSYLPQAPSRGAPSGQSASDRIEDRSRCSPIKCLPAAQLLNDSFITTARQPITAGVFIVANYIVVIVVDNTLPHSVTIFSLPVPIEQASISLFILYLPDKLTVLVIELYLQPIRVNINSRVVQRVSITVPALRILQLCSGVLRVNTREPTLR